MKHRPRFAGGTIAGIFAYLSICSMGIDSFSSLIVVLLWCCGLLIGGRYHAFYWLAKSEIRVKSNVMSWNGSLAGGFVGILCAVTIIDGPVYIAKIVNALSAPWALIYATSKFGCYRFGCCDWSDSCTNHLKWLKDRLPLQLLEITAASLTAIILVLINKYSQALWLPFILFILLHGILRLFSYYARYQPTIE